MLNKKQKEQVIFTIDHEISLYFRYTPQITMVPVEVTKYKNIYIKQAKINDYYPSNSICRETMITHIIRQLSEKPQRHTINMLIIIPKKHRDDLDKGIKLVNHYEKLLNWNKTRIYDVNKIPEIKKNQRLKNAYDKFSFILVVIPNKWLYSPQLISLYLMLLKVAETGFGCKFKTHKELINRLSTFFTQKPKDLRGFKFGFYHCVKRSYKYWNMFLYNLDTLYKNKTRKFNYNLNNELEKLYQSSKESSYKMHLDGINNLITNGSYDKQLRKNFNGLKKVAENE